MDGEFAKCYITLCYVEVRKRSRNGVRNQVAKENKQEYPKRKELCGMYHVDYTVLSAN